MRFRASWNLDAGPRHTIIEGGTTASPSDRAPRRPAAQSAPARSDTGAERGAERGPTVFSDIHIQAATFRCRDATAATKLEWRSLALSSQSGTDSDRDTISGS